MRRTASRAHKNAPVTFTAITCASALSVTDSTRENPPVMAALLTKALTGPSSRGGLKEPDDIFFAGNISLKGIGLPAGGNDLFDDRSSFGYVG